MAILPTEGLPLRAECAPVFTRPTWARFVVLLLGAILTTGRRSVAQVLRTMGAARDLPVEDLAQVGPVRLFAERDEKARPVVGTGNVVFRFDADQEAPCGIASEFFQASIDRDVPQRDGQQERAPEDFDGLARISHR